VRINSPVPVFSTDLEKHGSLWQKKQIQELIAAKSSAKSPKNIIIKDYTISTNGQII
jgi:hypothetical protein